MRTDCNDTPFPKSLWEVTALKLTRMRLGKAEKYTYVALE